MYSLIVRPSRRLPNAQWMWLIPLTTECGLNYWPLLGVVVGILKRGELDSALYHGIGCVR